LLSADGNVVETICDCLSNDARVNRSDRKGKPNLPLGITIDDIEKPIDPKLLDKRKEQDEKSRNRSKTPRPGDAGPADKRKRDEKTDN
ncbi:hypothetical protein ACO1MQ_13760, partial [Staphylococcus aureus]